MCRPDDCLRFAVGEDGLGGSGDAGAGGVEDGAEVFLLRSRFFGADDVACGRLSRVDDGRVRFRSADGATRRLSHSLP